MVPMYQRSFTLIQGDVSLLIWFQLPRSIMCRVIVWGGGVQGERVEVTWESVGSVSDSLDGAVVSSVAHGD